MELKEVSGVKADSSLGAYARRTRHAVSLQSDAIIASLLTLQFIDNFEEVLAVLVFNHGLGEFAHAVFGNPTFAVGDGFEAGDFKALTFLDDFDES